MDLQRMGAFIQKTGRVSTLIASRNKHFVHVLV